MKFRSLTFHLMKFSRDVCVQDGVMVKEDTIQSVAVCELQKNRLHCCASRINDSGTIKLMKKDWKNSTAMTGWSVSME
ncbi:hypothetical protein UPYG_G00249070 [Umbra pygmaea]|uniref:Uncharacterized protein n=1 Tax=Umbra pygmaea TaxID=75934 RepID=A0ABD0W774_UMBPY